MAAVTKLTVYADKLARGSQPKQVALCPYCAQIGMEIDSLTATKLVPADNAKCADCGAQAVKPAVVA